MTDATNSGTICSMVKRILALMGYDKRKVIQDETEFQRFILRALKEMTIREVAELSKTSLPTVQRWASGQTVPVQSMRKHIIKSIEPEMLRREDEYYDKYFGGRQKT